MKPVRLTLLPAVAAVLLLTVSDCGSTGTTAATTTGGGGTESGATPPAGGAGGGRVPGANGEIVDVSGRTMQVQSAGFGGQSTTQNAVTWTAGTVFTRQATGKL
ncbi:MAG: hypothetical protein QOJ72_1664, partial [Nocardioidaceae bacterium]|nr:hypothetical protein [Nocardioidaceae bacterium]